MTLNSQDLMRAVVPVLVIVLVVVRVAIRSAKARNLKIELMWIRPAIFLAIGCALLIGLPPPFSPISVAAIVAALALGAALGWQRGRLIRIEVHPETHEINQKASPAALIFLVVLIALRYVARNLAMQSLGSFHLSFNLITDTLGLFAVAMVVTQSAEMWTRARRLLAEARAARAAIQP